jgi:hypothetical protein
MLLTVDGNVRLFFWHRAATALAFAGVLAFASVVASFATTFALASVLSLAGMLPFFSHLRNGSSGSAAFEGGVGLCGIGSGEKSCESGGGNDVLGIHFNDGGDELWFC